MTSLTEKRSSYREKKLFVDKKFLIVHSTADGMNGHDDFFFQIPVQVQ